MFVARIIVHILGSEIAMSAYPAVRAFLLVLMSTVMATASGIVASAANPLEVRTPEEGVLMGVNVDEQISSVEAFNERLGRDAVAYGRFVAFPLDAGDNGDLDAFMKDVVEVGGIAILSVEPTIALSEITPDQAAMLADQLAAYNDDGAAVLLRFAPEMNGSWHPWGQQPLAYVEAFRLVADAIHESAPDTAMLWSPNYGAGYPFRTPSAEDNTSESLAILDTDGDGQLTMNDDPYAPYYPGDEYVDWVGMTLLHWGGAYPWGENEVPEPDKFVQQLQGRHVGANGDESYLPNFHETYVVATGKPLMVLTSALVNTEIHDGASALDIKQGWWRQVFGAARNQIPELALVEWFERSRNEPEAGNALIDWTIAEDEAVREAFLTDARELNIIFAPYPAK